ncbi:MAG: hypothetical protein ACXAAO_03345, partial [Candidatus Thorarchaeota archaeon]
MDSRDSERPTFSSMQAGELVKSLYGLSGTLSELPSERDQNFHLVTDVGDEFVLKIAAELEKRETLDMQNKAMSQLSEINSPKVRTSVNGVEIETTVSTSGTNHYVRLVSYLPGRVLAKVNPYSPDL